MKSLPTGGMWILTGLVAIGLTLAGSAEKASAVSVTTSTYAKDTGGPVAPNPSVKGPTTINHATSAVASMKSDTARAHATANATSKVVGGVITKSASGSGWVDATAPTFNTKSFSWSAVASGTQFVAQTIAPGGPTRVPFSINFPANDDPTFDYGFPTDGSFQNAFGGANPPAQGVVRRNAGIDPGVLATIPASMTEPTLDVRIVVIQQGVIDQTLFAGTATFRNNTGNTVDFTGSFLTLGVNSQTILDAATGTARTFLTNLPKLDFAVDPDKEFELLVDIRLAVGDPTAAVPEFDFPGTMSGNFGVSAAFASTPTMNDTQHFQLTVVPEPASVVLAALALGGAALLRRRKVAAANECG
jgi:hypothetical protein